MKIISMTYETVSKGTRTVQIHTDTDTIRISCPLPEPREELLRGWPGLLKLFRKEDK